MCVYIPHMQQPPIAVRICVCSLGCNIAVYRTEVFDDNASGPEYYDNDDDHDHDPVGYTSPVVATADDAIQWMRNPPLGSNIKYAYLELVLDSTFATSWHVFPLQTIIDAISASPIVFTHLCIRPIIDHIHRTIGDIQPIFAILATISSLTSISVTGSLRTAAVSGEQWASPVASSFVAIVYKYTTSITDYRLLRKLVAETATHVKYGTHDPTDTNSPSPDPIQLAEIAPMPSVRHFTIVLLDRPAHSCVQQHLDLYPKLTHFVLVAMYPATADAQVGTIRHPLVTHINAPDILETTVQTPRRFPSLVAFNSGRCRIHGDDESVAPFLPNTSYLSLPIDGLPEYGPSGPIFAAFFLALDRLQQIRADEAASAADADVAGLPDAVAPADPAAVERAAKKALVPGPQHRNSRIGPYPRPDPGMPYSYPRRLRGRTACT